MKVFWKKKIRIIVHWSNEHPEKKCKKCSGDFCKKNFSLGITSRKYNDKGKLEESGTRYKIDGCFGKDARQYYKYLELYYNFKLFGLPCGNGWVNEPKKTLRILQIVEDEQQYKRTI